MRTTDRRNDVLDEFCVSRRKAWTPLRQQKQRRSQRSCDGPTAAFGQLCLSGSQQAWRQITPYADDTIHRCTYISMHLVMLWTLLLPLLRSTQNLLGSIVPRCMKKIGPFLFLPSSNRSLDDGLLTCYLCTYISHGSRVFVRHAMT